MAIIGNPTPGNDSISGDEGNNLISALAGNDTVNGNGGNDILNGGDGIDILNGGDGNDTLKGDAGNDTLIGGAGIDRVKVNAFGSNITLTNNSVTGDGVDSLTGIENAELFVFSNNSAPINIDASAFTNGSVTLDGNSASNILLGSQGSDFLDGEGSVDTLIGGNGNDTLNGGEGAGTDLLTGGAGSDRFLFDMNRPLRSSDGFDRITDFVRGTDKIVLDKSTFTALASGPGSLLPSDFELVDSIGGLQFSNAKIVYHPGSGTLVYNQNGSAPGLLTVGGTGGVIAGLDGNPNISLSDFIVVA